MTAAAIPRHHLARHSARIFHRFIAPGHTHDRPRGVLGRRAPMIQNLLMGVLAEVNGDHSEFANKLQSEELVSMLSRLRKQVRPNPVNNSVLRLCSRPLDGLPCAAADTPIRSTASPWFKRLRLFPAASSSSTHTRAGFGYLEPHAPPIYRCWTIRRTSKSSKTRSAPPPSTSVAHPLPPAPCCRKCAHVLCIPWAVYTAAHRGVPCSIPLWALSALYAACSGWMRSARSRRKHGRHLVGMTARGRSTSR